MSQTRQRNELYRSRAIADFFFGVFPHLRLSDLRTCRAVVLRDVEGRAAERASAGRLASVPFDRALGMKRMLARQYQ